jgi:hypothetical protein
LVLRVIGGSEILEAGRGDEMAARVREPTARAENAGGGGVQFGLEAELFGRFAQVAIQPKRVINRLAAGRVSPDVRGAVLTMGDYVNVKLSPATGATSADLSAGVQRAAKGSGDGSEQVAHGGVVEPAGVI